MNPLKLSVAVAVAGLFAGTGTVAFSQELGPYTYFFTATPNSDDPFVSDMDGSTITIQDGAISSWYLNDTEYDGAVLTPANSSFVSESISYSDAATWIGDFAIGYVQLDTQYCFLGDNSSTGGDLDFRPRVGFPACAGSARHLAPFRMR